MSGCVAALHRELVRHVGDNDVRLEVLDDSFHAVDVPAGSIGDEEVLLPVTALAYPLVDVAYVAGIEYLFDRQRGRCVHMA